MSEKTGIEKKQISCYPIIRLTAVEDDEEYLVEVNLLNIDEVIKKPGDPLTTIKKISRAPGPAPTYDGFKETPYEICDLIHRANYNRSVMLVSHVRTLGGKT